MVVLIFILYSSGKVYPMSDSLYKFAETRFKDVFECCRIHAARIMYMPAHFQMKIVSDDERIFSKMERRVISKVNKHILV